MGQASNKHECGDEKDVDGQLDNIRQDTVVDPDIGATSQYPEQPCNYIFENFAAVRHILAGTGFWDLSPFTLATIDPDIYMPRLTELYTEGYCLLSFVVKPVKFCFSFCPQKLKSDINCQAIFRKVKEGDCNETYTIKHERSTLPCQAFVAGGVRIQSTNSNTDNIRKTIQEEAATGSRLVCVEVTGFGQYLPYNSTMIGKDVFSNRIEDLDLMADEATEAVDSVFGVDLFFEVPRFPGSPKYIYQYVPVQMNLTTSYRKSVLSFDWLPVVKSYCGTGWRLVEVFLDQRGQINLNGDQNLRHPLQVEQVISLETIFVFEKEETKIDDNTPVFEVTVVEFVAKLKEIPNPTKATVYLACTWEDTLAKMGAKGWELVRILFTPLLEFKSGFFTIKYERKLHIFMQREMMQPSTSQTQSNIGEDSLAKPEVDTSEPINEGAEPDTKGTERDTEGEEPDNEEAEPVTEGRNRDTEGAEFDTEGMKSALN